MLVLNISSGSDLVSRAVTRQVSSAQWSLTSVFGMGTGVTSTLLPPDISLSQIQSPAPSKLYNVKRQLPHNLHLALTCLVKPSVY